MVTVLARARQEAGLTRAALAEASGVSFHTIAKIEQTAVTDPGFTVVATLANTLDLSLDELARRARSELSDPSHAGPLSNSLDPRQSDS